MSKDSQSISLSDFVRLSRQATRIQARLYQYSAPPKDQTRAGILCQSFSCRRILNETMGDLPVLCLEDPARLLVHICQPCQSVVRQPAGDRAEYHLTFPLTKLIVTFE